MSAIRPFGRQWSDQVMALFDQFPAMFDDKELQQIQHQLDFPDGAGFVYLKDELVVGYGYLRLLPGSLPSADLQWLVVDKDHHNGGIGRQLVEHAQALARGWGAKSLSVATLHSSDPVSKNALNFYKRLGFSQSRIVPNYWGPGEDKIYFVKSLENAIDRLKLLLTGKGQGQYLRGIRKNGLTSL